MCHWKAYIEYTSPILTQSLFSFLFRLDAFHRLEAVTRSHTLLQDELENKEAELQRLRAAEEKSRASITVRAI